jgi:hypothetical protein
MSFQSGISPRLRFGTGLLCVELTRLTIARDRLKLS